MPWSPNARPDPALPGSCEGPGPSRGYNAPVGYDLHICRSEDWADAAKDPIDELEWVEVVRANGLERAGEADSTPIYIGRSGENALSYLWMNGEIVVTGATQEPDIVSAVSLAEQLGARVVGDDGETYPVSG